jgi:hypothetical protein
VDAAGNVTAIWNGDVHYYYHLHPIVLIAEARTVLAARFTPATGTWGPVIPLSNSGPIVVGAQLAVDAAGNVTAIWESRPTGSDQSVVQAVRYDAATGALGAPVNVSTTGQFGDGPIIACNPAGIVMAIWARGPDPHRVVEASQFHAATGTWTPAASLSQPSDRHARQCDRHMDLG